MEGVGARLGRTSTRYGPATVFTGPVRKWKKKWVHVAPSTKDNNNHNHNHNHNHSHQIHNHGGATATATAANGTSTNGNNGSHLLLYKWTPITQSQNTNNNNNNNSSNNNNSNTNVNGGDKGDVAAAPEEPPRRKIRYIPIAVLEEQKNEDAENEDAEKVDDDDEDDDDDDKQIDIDPNASESTAKVEVLDEKPDINDVPMEENQENNQLIRQDLNERTLDLSLGLKAHDDDHDPDSKTD
ncbi:hypothetical protein ACB098_05G163400 [Castanea mollissima]